MLLSLAEVLIDTLIKVVVLDIEVISICSKKFAWQELFKDLALEFLNDVFAIDGQDHLLSLLLQLVSLFSLFHSLSFSRFFRNWRSFFDLLS